MILGRRIAFGLALVSLLALSPACGGSSSSGSSGGECAAPFSTELSGTWLVLEDIETSSGGCATEQRSYSTLCTQTPSGEQLTFLGRTTFPATLCGSRATSNFDFSIPEIWGLRTYNNLVIQYQSPTSFTATARWTYRSTAGTSTCQGTSSFRGTR